MEPLDQLVSSWIMPPVWLSRRFMAQSPFVGEYILLVTSELGSDVAPKTGTSDCVYWLVQPDHISCPSAPFIGPHKWENCLVKVTPLWSWQLTRCWRHSGVFSFQPDIDLKGSIFFFLSLCVKRLKTPTALRFFFPFFFQVAICKWKVATSVFYDAHVHSDYGRHWTAEERAPPIY